MFSFLVMYDSCINEQEERMIELSLVEVASLFPSLNLIIFQPGEYEILPLADIAVEKSRPDKNGAINAIDALKMVSKGAAENYAILFVSREMYVNVSDLGIDSNKTENVIDVLSENALVCSIGSLRSLDLEDQIHMVQHSVCNAIGQLVFDLSDECHDRTCMMYKVGSEQETLELAKREDHGKQRLCKKCLQKSLNKISVEDRMTPSRIDIC